MRRLLALFVLVGCGASGSPARPDGSGSNGMHDGSVVIDAPKPPADAPPDAAHYRFLCEAPPPPGSPTPTNPPLKMGCPALHAGENSLTSSNVARSFQMVFPASMAPGEVFPVIVMWHWLKSSSQDFIDTGMVQAAADDQRFIAVLPDNIPTDITFTTYDVNWPFDISQPQTRMDQEFTFFDDMLSCVEQQFAVNLNCVTTVGVSAGGLFIDQLIQARSQTLASFVSLSGGVGDTIIKPWVGAARKLPGLVLWGGKGPPTMTTKDILGCFGIGMDFSVASQALETGMTNDGHFLVECVHNCGHAVPPLPTPPGQSQFAGVWEFLFNHPFWLAAGQSPYLTTGLPDLPSWCAIGQNNAVPRSDTDCPDPINPCPF